MTITISSSSGDPIYLQIVEQIKSQILDGTLAAGEPLPSMRNLATDLRISFMTTKRAYEELEREGFIESFTGKGSFVKAQNMQLFREEQLRRMEQSLADVCEAARKAGVSIQELHEMLDYINGGDFE
ncbi:MAG: GntR family transcriptional regulator [Lachnospiraceae bacterium]|nr:GntR family transcriptional regulator [Lachnospiraceae bacterium]MBR4812887.1 GntR family transcriptional regulator [Lachnospiraceae bacterium]MBR6018781.1 GntR family transcriptional regulator [Lachnospiraceae bacterium]